MNTIAPPPSSPSIDPWNTISISNPKDNNFMPNLSQNQFNFGNTNTANTNTNYMGGGLNSFGQGNVGSDDPFAEIERNSSGNANMNTHMGMSPTIKTQTNSSSLSFPNTWETNTNFNMNTNANPINLNMNMNMNTNNLGSGGIIDIGSLNTNNTYSNNANNNNDLYSFGLDMGNTFNPQQPQNPKKQGNEFDFL
jgi:hypothetical protein